jgi:hypothetical protein
MKHQTKIVREWDGGDSPHVYHVECSCGWWSALLRVSPVVAERDGLEHIERCEREDGAR